MEMESSRRSIDRSREPGLKKPRLVEDAERDRISNGVMDRSRPRVVSSNAAATGVLPSRFRTTERERDDSSSVRGVQQQGQQQQQSQQSHLELVSQYKTALAELTFNSKPIITNLTIIAGENLHAAKWIAATVCANILEVPSEQKLPSLYLLDSIVKNIGRDYIKYFAAKLPEVFCKAYRQVDSSIHPGMRHLFGTWKGVFPPSCLQMIEKELGIAPASNGSSGATTSRSESQSQRPPHSIHVNPKYLEARQRLQQSSKVKGGNASTVSIIPPAEVAERPDRTANIVSESVWTDLPLKMNDYKHPQRETSSEPVIEKNNVGYEDYEYSSDLSRNSDMGYGRAAERVTERDKRDKPWYGTEKNAAEAVVGQRNAFDSQRELSKFRAPKPALAAAALQPTGSTQRSASSGRGMNKNWKNSEEEEYMWDDMNSRLADRGSSDSSRKDVWPPNDAEKMELDDNVSQPCVELDIGSRIHRDNSTDSFSMVQRRQTAFGNLTPSMWPLRETHTRDNLKHMGITSRIPGQSENLPTSISGSSTSISPSLARTGLKTPTGLSASGTPSFGSLVNTLSSSGILGQPRHQPLHPASPSGQASILQRPHSPSSSAFRQQHESHNLTEEDHLHSRSISQLGPKTSHYVPQLNRAPQTPTTHNSFPIIPQNPIQSGTLQGFPSQSSQHLQSSSSLMNFPPRRPHSPFSFQPLPELTPSQHSGQIQKPVPQSSGFGIPSVTGHSLSSHTTNPAADVPGQSNTRNLLAAIAESGLLSNNAASGGFPNLSFLESGALSSKLQNHPPLPSGPPPTQIGTSSAPMATLASVLDSASPAGTLSLTSHPHRTSTLPPLPPGPPPSSSVVSTSSQTSNAASSVPNPYSGLLSSLVAKGLISTPTKESPVLPAAAQVPSRLQNQSPGLSTNNSVPISSHPAPSATTIPKSSSGNELPFLESAVKSAPAIGSPATRTETKDLIGIEFKPEIIRQSHPSVISGLFDDLPHQCNICGFRLKLKEQLSHHLDRHASRKPEPSSGRVSRKWYTTSCDWVAGNVNSSSGSVLTSSVGGMTRAAEQSEPVVLADESQCVCLLCGEIFEDFYCHERDEWMYKGAVYMPIPAVNGEIGAMDDCSVQGPIVHANCISPSSVYDLGLLKNVKQEPMDG